MSGVRRAVAAREAGLTSFRAVVVDNKGNTVAAEREVLLALMVSPKPLVERLDRYGRYAKIERGMADPVTRSAIPALELRPVSPTEAARRTPLAAVGLTI